MMKNNIDELVYEDTHQVEPTMAIVVRSHCTNNSQGEYTLAVEVHQNGTCKDVYIGQDAITFLASYKNTLEEG